MKYVLSVLFGGILAIIFVGIFNNSRTNYSEDSSETDIKIKFYEMYVMKTEALLDSINAYYSDFNDVIAEMDVYDEYLSAKASLTYEAFQKLRISESKEVWSLS